MNNLNKRQLEVFKSALSGSKTVRCDVDGSNVYFCENGYDAFRIPARNVLLDLCKIASADLKRHFKVDKDDLEVKKTNTMKSFPSGVALKFHCDKFDVYVDNSFFKKYYDHQKLFCAGPKSPLKLVSPVTGLVDAVILPVIIREDNETC